MDQLERLKRIGKRLEKQPERIFYYTETYLKVRDKSGRVVPLVANDAQREYERRRAQQNIVLKARQMGMTTWIAARFFLKTITVPGTMTLQVAHTRAAAESIFRMVQRMWQELPEELRSGPLKRSRANVGQMIFPALDSEFRIASACDEGVGRGITVQNLHCSEVSRWPGDAAETLAGLRAALAPGGELVLESTPNGAYGAFYKAWNAAVDGTAAEEGCLVRHFLPWWLEPAYVGRAVDAETLTEDEQRLVEQQGLSLEKIGFRRSLQRSYGALRSQEFAEDAETCFRATGSCCFEIEAIERMLLDPWPEIEARRNGALLVWLGPQPQHEYLVAVDTSGGSPEGDFAAMQVLELRTGLQCAELQQRLAPVDQARVAAALAHEYNGATLVVESNNHGGSVLAYLRSGARYDNLWVDEHEGDWLTTSANKPEILAELGTLLLQRPLMFRSRRLLGECRTFITKKRGSGAAPGAHDDLVMAMAIGQSVRAQLVARGRGRKKMGGGLEKQVLRFAQDDKV